MRGLSELIELAERDRGHRVLRFSRSDTSRYRWASVETDSIEVMQFLCAAWNHRQAIALALRARALSQATPTAPEE